MKKPNQEELILNYLQANPKRKLTARRAMNVVKSTSKTSMQTLLPSMVKKGVIARIKTGTYVLNNVTEPVRKTKTTIAPKSFTNESTIKSKLLAKKEELLSQVTNIDKHIEAIDKVYALSSKLLK